MKDVGIVRSRKLQKIQKNIKIIKCKEIHDNEDHKAQQKSKEVIKFSSMNSKCKTFQQKFINDYRFNYNSF